jgi:polyisoprenoid-binding protein YceI
VRLDGTLTVAGVTQHVRLDVSTAAQLDNTVAVQGTLPLTLSGFSITPPRVLFGAIRARDRISVEVDLRFPRVLLIP